MTSLLVDPPALSRPTFTAWSLSLTCSPPATPFLEPWQWSSWNQVTFLLNQPHTFSGAKTGSRISKRTTAHVGRVHAAEQVEHFDRRTTLGEGPCKALQKPILSEVQEPAEDEHDVVFRVRCYHDRLIHLRALISFPPSSVSQTLYSPSLFQGVPSTLRVIYAHFLQLEGGCDHGVHSGTQRLSDRQV